MWEEYELTYIVRLELRNENLTDVAKMKKRIQELKRRDTRFGKC